MAQAGYNWRQAAEHVESRQIALRMRAEGYTLSQIGDALGLTKQSVHSMLRRAIQRVDTEGVGELRAVWNARYEADYHALDAKAQAGDVDAINARTRIGASVATLNGLNAPVQLEHSGHVDVTQLGDDELRAIIEASRSR